MSFEIPELSRRNFVKGAGVALAGAFAAGALAGCGSRSANGADEGDADAQTAEPAEQSAAASVAMTPGVYTSMVDSIKGPMDVTVAVSETAIQSITLKGDDTKHVIAAALTQMVPAMLAAQSTEVDIVSGATFTSSALRRGVRECLDQAGAGDAFKQAAATQQVQGEDETFDAVVVGSGGAGLSAAIQLAKAGKRTCLLERNSYFGGTTGFSSGGVWTVGGTEFNESTGFDYDAAGLAKHLYDASEQPAGSLNDELIAAIARVAGDVYTEYHEAGSPWDTQRYTFGDALSEMPVSWPVMFYDNDYENNCGMTLIDFLVRHAQENGVDLRLNSPVSGIIAEGGAAAGVHVNGRAKAYDIHADVVVLATGGFQRNADLVAELAPDFTTMVPFTAAGSNGDGIVMARELGAATRGDGVAGSLGLNEQLGYCGPLGTLTYCTTLRVNKDGVRFMNDAGHYTTYPSALCSQPDGVCWGIADSASWGMYGLDELVERGYAVRADSLEELAAAIDVPADAFVATVEAYNALAAAGTDDPEFGLPAAAMTPAVEAPFYAIETHLVSFGVTCGLAVDEACNVVDEGGAAIPGLYAAGELIAGNLMSHRYTGSGSQIGPSMYEGRIIADAVA